MIERTTTEDLLRRAGRVLGYGGLFSVVEGVLADGDRCFPHFASHGQGCRVVDSTGQEFVDWFLGWGPVVLGHRHPAVDTAIVDQLRRGIHLSLMSPLEIEVAERLTEIFPCAERVVFGKNGSDMTTAAVRIARAATGRERVLACGYHGFHDWFRVLDPNVRGVPQALRGLIANFAYNDLQSARDALAQSPSAYAAIILEPMHDMLPVPGFLAGLRELADEFGAVLIFDEVVTGLRIALGGAQELFGVVPDLACVGKALANGMPLAALVGKAALMAHYPGVGVGMTFRGECLSYAAARASLDVLQREPVCAHLAAVGTEVRDAFHASAAARGLDWRLSGHPSRMNFHVRGGGRISGPGAQAVFLQECLRGGVLTHGVLLASYAQDRVSVDQTKVALDRALAAVARALERQSLDDVLAYRPPPHFYTDHA